MTPLGFALRKYRAALKMSLRQHADKVGVTPGFLSGLEHGRRGVPTESMRKRIIDALQLDSQATQELNDLARISDPKVLLDTAGLSHFATAFANELADVIRDLTDNELRNLSSTLKKMSDKPIDSE